ncbi:uncharacterized protein SPPG_08477 [Spizellomyces punctatus DAOM BR117]|uniref:Uncharacterized protein n=1 Tax=Spizellomyces punctatus (strain DAOM BR117) TaxID=645134 RepID=A0A0L0H5C2_SPIPD|nr:uncharacterized protein SPPG_08477 [Spizellomyces punctatus DAOM BR117]KNC96091.1 hypothetical protein SPPG_08477 [Spizellomyces punctatus DAOM BR117]|eukprot:XP_016604131.1 hypothetical protein SPPG_08477 [Spizellomyces punctatus DAOM BR117]
MGLDHPYVVQLLEQMSEVDVAVSGSHQRKTKMKSIREDPALIATKMVSSNVGGAGQKCNLLPDERSLSSLSFAEEKSRILAQPVWLSTTTAVIALGRFMSRADAYPTGYQILKRAEEQIYVLTAIGSREFQARSTTEVICTEKSPLLTLKRLQNVSDFFAGALTETHAAEQWGFVDERVRRWFADMRNVVSDPETLPSITLGENCSGHYHVATIDGPRYKRDTVTAEFTSVSELAGLDIFAPTFIRTLEMPLENFTDLSVSDRCEDGQYDIDVESEFGKADVEQPDNIRHSLTPCPELDVKPIEPDGHQVLERAQSVMSVVTDTLREAGSRLALLHEQQKGLASLLPPVIRQRLVKRDWDAKALRVKRSYDQREKLMVKELKRLQSQISDAENMMAIARKKRRALIE